MLLELPSLGFSSLRKNFLVSHDKKVTPRKNVKVFCVVLEEHSNSINSSSIILLDDFVCC